MNPAADPEAPDFRPCEKDYFGQVYDPLRRSSKKEEQENLKLERMITGKKKNETTLQKLGSTVKTTAGVLFAIWLTLPHTTCYQFIPFDV